VGASTLLPSSTLAALSTRRPSLALHDAPRTAAPPPCSFHGPDFSTPYLELSVTRTLSLANHQRKSPSSFGPRDRDGDGADRRKAAKPTASSPRPR